MNKKDLIDRLIDIQEAHGWSDDEMGQRLGVDRTFWIKAKQRQRGLGLKFLRGALTAFRELTEEAVDYIVEQTG